MLAIVLLVFLTALAPVEVFFVDISDGKSYLVSSFYLRFLSFPLLSHRFSVRCRSMFLLVA